MKYYEGNNSGAGGQTILVCKLRKESFVNHNILKHYVRHSPDGFQWGYGGSGPAETARCILIDYFNGDEKAAELIYQEFKWKFISSAGKRLFITEKNIRDWLKEGERSIYETFRKNRILAQ